jgi:hypothetical protein
VGRRGTEGRADEATEWQTPMSQMDQIAIGGVSSLRLLVPTAGLLATNQLVWGRAKSRLWRCKKKIGSRPDMRPRPR